MKSARSGIPTVGIVTRCVLGGPEIESLWKRGLPHRSRPALGPTKPPVQWEQGKASGAWCWPPTPI